MGFVFTEWYETHGKGLNEARRERYKNDPSYREQVRARNAKSRQERRRGVQEETAHAEAARKAPRAPRWKELTVPDPNDATKTVAAFSIGALAAASNRSIQTLRKWEEEKVIPAADTTSGKGDRLYTIRRIEEIVNTLEERGLLGDTGRQHRAIPAVSRAILFADGREETVELYQIATLVQAVGRTLVTLQQMEGRGVLPPTPFRASRRRYRLYTLPQIEAVAAAFQKYPTLRAKEVQGAFHAFILAAWERAMPGLSTARLKNETAEADAPETTEDAHE